MPLFGSQYGAQSQMASTPMPVQAPQAKRKRGLFGSTMDYLMADSGTPGLNRLATIGATLKDLGGVVDGGETDNLMMMQQLAYKRQQDAQQQAWQQEQQERQRQQWQMGDQQQAALQQFIQSLPDDSPFKPLIGIDQEAGIKAYAESLKPKDPEYRSVKGDLLRLGPDGRPELIYRAPADPVGGNQRPKLSEVRQWGQGYNDDSVRIKDKLGNARAAIPYASGVINNRGNPPVGSNPRMADVQLLRAAARAQTGPGVLMESEVFGTLSPSLQQEIRNKGAYFDASQVTLTPQDRLALARNVAQGAADASGDLWRLYDSTKGTLESYGVPLKEAGILAPDMPHPDDMPALNSSLKKYEVGKQYQGPTGRIYKFKGAGNWEFVREAAPTYYNNQNGGAQQPGKPKRIPLEPNP